jgi:hypothetical protein
MFVTGSSFAILDPHQKYATAKDPSPGRRYDFIESALLERYEDQMAPFCMFNQNLHEEFDGTLFRFPLRTSEVAERSAISSKVVTVTEVRDMFEEFQKEANQVLLFLKSINSVSLYEWHEGDSQPSKTFSIDLREIKTHATGSEGSSRTAVASFVTNLQKGLSCLESDKSEDGVKKHMSEMFRGLKAAEKLPVHFYTAKVTSSTGYKIDGNTAMTSRTEEYIVGNGLYSGPALEFAEQASAKSIHLKLLPWVGIAMRISSDGKSKA